MSAFARLPRLMFRGLRALDVGTLAAESRFAELRRRYYRQYWLKVAQETGAKIETLGHGFTRLIRNGTKIIVRSPEVRLDDHLTLELMGNKLLTYRLLAEQGCEVPRHVPFTLRDMTPAIRLLEESGRPLVVKPVSGTGGGRGVTTGITSASSLRLAAFLASRFDMDLMAEEQIEGHSYRLLYLDGRMIDAIRRDQPHVAGDGENTIAALAAQETKRRLSGLPYTALSPLLIDREAKLYLASQNLTPRSVPAPGERIAVKRASNQNHAGENHVVSSQVHPATVAACARLVKTLGVEFAGVDIIARDISTPLDKNNGLIGEINTTPGLHHHHLVDSRPAGTSIGAAVAEYLFAKASTPAASHMRVAAE